MPWYMIIAPLLWGVFHWLTGFAGPLILMLLLSPYIPLTALTPLVALAWLLINLLLIVRHHAHLSWSLLRPLLFPSLLGIPVGYVLLHHLSDRAGELVIACVILGFLLVYHLLSARGRHLPARLRRVLSWSAGVFWFAYNINGPQLAARTLASRLEKQTSVALSVTYFFVFNSVFVAIHRLSWWMKVSSLIDQRDIFFMALCLLLGLWWWDRLLKRIGAHHFQYLLQLFLFMSAVLFLV